MFLRRFFGHLCTITKHRHEVIKNCARSGILWRGLVHDLSKYSPAEFFKGVKYYTGKCSPNEGERADKGYSLAWMHHKGRNRHHFEYWTDYDPVTKKIIPIKMPLKYVVEMFCDRVAASRVYKGRDYTDSAAAEYFMKAKGRRVINPETSDFLEKLLIMLAEDGEKKTFKYIREYIKNNSDY